MLLLSETKTIREGGEVRRRLIALQTSIEKLLRVRAVAIGAAADATPFHPANAAGTFAYQHGTFALRSEHVGHDGWEMERPNGVEVIKNCALKVRIVFANVDVACNDAHEPKARSEKGAGAERLCVGNGLFASLPHFGRQNDDGWATYYLMVDPNGAAELTRATVENGRFKDFIERLFLSDGTDLEADPTRIEVGGEAEEFDPIVARKK